MRMRRLLPFLLLLSLLLAVHSFAAEPALTVSSEEAQNGKTVYLTVTLQPSITADTLGISYSYDPEVLKPLPDSCSWNKKGVLQDFNLQNKGVWTTSAAVSLQGDLCILAFRVLDGADFSTTAVKCTLIAKKDDQTVAEYEAQGTVTQVCSHVYGKWEQQNEQFHSHTCSRCGSSVSQSHQWGNGTVKNDPNHPGKQITEFQCGSCGAKKTVDAVIEDTTLFPQVSQPTTPEDTHSTLPVPTMPVIPVDPSSPTSGGTKCCD